MNKTLKKLLIAIVSTTAALSMTAFAACNNSNNETNNPSNENPGITDPGTDNPGTDNPGTDNPGTDNPGTDNPGTDNPGTDNPGTDNPGYANNYTFEAEYTDLDGKPSGGWSGAPEGVLSIVEDTHGFGASNGYYLPYTWRADYTITFEISSNSDAEAELSVRLASNFENITLTPEIFAVKVNGEVVQYGSWAMPNVGQHPTLTPSQCDFADYLAGTVQLDRGSNTIELIVLENNLVQDRNIGPIIDCIKIKTDANLSTYEFEENLDWMI